jgi:RHS repeat-associated protein
MKTGNLGAASVTTYIYNALGRRVKKSGGAITTAVYFAYDEAGHLVGEYNISGSTITAVQETVWLGDTPVATLRSGTGAAGVFYVHTDQLNTPRKVTNTSNQLRWTWDPNPFGDGPASTLNENPASLGSFKYNLRFPGQSFDLESNLSYNYFRDYDPTIGSYVESDPIGLSGGLATYSYALADPSLTFDEYGLAPGEIFPTQAAAQNDLNSYLKYLHANKGGLSLQGQINNFLYPQGFPYVLKISDCAWTWDLTEMQIGFPPEFGKPGGLGRFKGTDALRRENNMARDAATAARLTRAERRELHDRISRENITSYQEIKRIAQDIAAGK